MRQEDRKAFVEEYLALCRKYGMCVESFDEFGDPNLLCLDQFCEAHEEYIRKEMA